MSRIGKKPIIIPAGVNLAIHPSTVEVKGAKGTLTVPYENTFISIKQEDTELILERAGDSNTQKARHGLYRQLINNAVEGVQNGYSKQIEIRGVGYRVAIKGDVLEFALGFSHPVKYTLPNGIAVKADEKNANILTISGIDKQQVGQIAAEIRALKKPEPYKGKGIRYVGEYVVQKAGKSIKGKK